MNLRMYHRYIVKIWCSVIIIGVVIGIVIATGFIIYQYRHLGPPGLYFYRAITSGKLLLPHKRFAAVAPRQITFTGPYRPITGITLNVGKYSFIFPRTAKNVGLSWWQIDDIYPPKMIRSVTFLLPDKDRNFSPSGLAKFVTFMKLRPYAPAPKGMIEIGDESDGYFLVPDKAKSITVRIKPTGHYTNIHSFGVTFSDFGMSCEPVSQWSDPRYFFERLLVNIWPIKDLTKPLSKVLSTCGISGKNAQKLIHNVIRRQLATHTDLELLQDALMVTTTKLKNETDIKKALWMTLELELFMYNRYGPVIWVHLNRGRTLCFVSGPLGAEVWVFNVAGRATCEGLVAYNGPKWGPHSVWSSWLRILKAQAVPFFSQPAPPFFAVRRR